MKALKSLLTNRYITCIIVVCGLKVNKLGSISKNLKVTLCGFKLEDQSCIDNNRFKSQKQPLEVFCKKGVLSNFAKFTGKHLCQSLFF